MHPFELALAIVLIVTIGSVLKSRHRSEREDRIARGADPGPETKTDERLQTLEERVAVLERIVTDRGYELRQKFRDLEDR